MRELFLNRDALFWMMFLRRYQQAQSSGVWKTVSGALIHIMDALTAPVKNFTATFEPQQDLHGYDNPWPAGGGVNKLPPSNADTKSRTQNGLTCVAGDDGVYTFTGTISGGAFDQTFTLPQTYVIQDGDYLHLRNTATNASGMMFLIFTDGNINKYFSSVNATVSLSEHVGKTIKSVRFYISATYNGTVSPMIINSSSATAFIPYENICPITGYTGCEVTVAGQNIFDVDALTTVTPIIGGNTYYGAEFSKAGTYAIKAYGTGSSAYLYARVRNADGTTGNTQYIVANTSTTPTIIDLQENCLLFIYCATASSTLSAAKTLFTNWQVQVAYQDTQPDSYSEYQGTTIPIKFPATGKNLFDKTATKVTTIAEVDFRTITYCSANVAGVNANNQYISVSSTCESLGIPVQKDDVVKVYLFGDLPDTQRFQFCICDDTGLSLVKSTYAISPTSQGIPRTGSITAEYSGYMFVEWGLDATANDGLVITKNETSSLTVYEPYNTAYSGTLTNKGTDKWELVVDNQKLSCTTYSVAGVRTNGYYCRLNVTGSYLASSDDSLFKANIAEIDRYSNASTPIKKLCISSAGNAGTTMTWMHCYIPDTVVNYDPEGSLTLAQCIARDLPPANWEIIAPLPEPITYQLTSDEVLTLLQGENNIWTNFNGETEVTYLVDTSKTVTGTLLHILDALRKPAKKLTVGMSPVQDLNGQDAPYPAGGGSQLLDVQDIAQITRSGITFKVEDARITASGTTTQGENFQIIPSTSPVALKAGTYTFSFTGTCNGAMQLRRVTGSPSVIDWINSSSRTSTTITLENDESCFINLNLGQAETSYTVDGKIKLESGSTATAWSPYSNICPITGWTGVDVYDDPKYGGFINFNQIIKNGDFESTSGWVATYGSISVSNNECAYTYDRVGTANANRIAILGSNKPLVTAGDIYAISAFFKTPYAQDVSFAGYSSEVSKVTIAMQTKSIPANTWTQVVAITNGTNTGLSEIRFGFHSSEQTAIGDVAYIKNAMMLNLTQMFGAGNEPSTVEEVKALFPKEYYAYNTGTETTVSTVNGGQCCLPYKFPALGKNPFDPNSPEHWVIAPNNTKSESVNSRSVIIPAQSGDTFTMSLGSKNNCVHYIAFVDDAGNILDRYGTSSANSVVRTAPDGTAYCYAGVTIIANVTDVQVERGASATFYEPFTNTVYGGTFTINEDGSGEIVATWLYVTVDGVNKKLNVSSASYIGEITTRAYFNNRPDLSIDGVSSMQNYVKCDSAKYNNTLGEQGYQFIQLTTNSGEINFRLLNSLTGVVSGDTTTQAATKINAYLASNPINVVYALKEPATYTLTAQQVLKLLKGENNIWSNANGEIELTYLPKVESTP